MDPIAAAVDGLVSAVIGYAVAAMVPAFLTVFYSLNSPWYIPALYVVFVVATIAAEAINQVAGSLAYAAGFLYGAYLLHDWVAFGGVLVLSVIVLYFRYRNS